MASESASEATAGPKSFSTSSPSSSILFQSDSFVLLDIPRSLEEAQVAPGHQPSARILSGAPPLKPFITPEPRDGAAATGHWLRSSQSAGAHIADLMAAAAVQSALDQLRCRYSGPFCLPRLCDSPDGPVPMALDTGHTGINTDGTSAASAVTTCASPGGASSSLASQARIPHGAEYLHGSIQGLRQAFIDRAPQFRLIVLDPPWPNRSAKRKKAGSYNIATNLSEIQHLLSSIPVPSHLASDGLVAMWITNKASVLDLVTSPKGIFASWGLELVTQWTWLKITSSGEPLFDIESTWRKPWETLLIAKRVGAKAPSGLKPQVIVAVPDRHSRKPNLRRLFQDSLGPDYPALEVFARNLTSGWWSWGDQVLHFQASEHWTNVDD
ncbi:mt-a70 family [Trichoderma arundinaceum]|uniref:Mt-a70 family n=1 Tax=Trichoderma arundinaceum TaxID=490622 RepID=A0A395NEE0_TRIAR|nr:mt-a70 family [Trichoderma arundinaceum]